jgi:hypothetical protein
LRVFDFAPGNVFLSRTKRSRTRALKENKTMSSGEATRRQPEQDTDEGDQKTDVNRKQGQNPGQNQGQQNPGQRETGEQGKTGQGAGQGMGQGSHNDPSKSGQSGQNREGDQQNQQKKSGTSQDDSDAQRKGNREGQR